MLPECVPSASAWSKISCAPSIVPIDTLPGIEPALPITMPCDDREPPSKLLRRVSVSVPAPFFWTLPLPLMSSGEGAGIGALRRRPARALFDDVALEAAAARGDEALQRARRERGAARVACSRSCR